MQRSLTYALAAVLLSWAAAPAQSAPSAGQAAPTAPALAAGTVVGAEFSKGIDAKKAKVGQEVIAKSLADLRDANGNLVIPRGAKLVGHVTEVKAASKQEPQSTLGVIFDKAEAKQGKEAKEIGMHAAIQALAKPRPSAMMEESPGPAEGPGGAQGGGNMGGAQPGMGPGGAGGGRTMGGTTPGQTGEMGGGNMGGPMEQQAGGGGPAINANSHGAIGFPNLTLSPQASPSEGSLISSSKGNVKLDGGTRLVLRVIGQ